MMPYSNAIYQSLLNHLQEKTIKYEFNQDTGYFKAEFTLTKSKVGSVFLLLVLHENCFMSYGVMHIHATQEARSAVGEFLTRVNYSVRVGNFDMDYKDGEIRYKIYCHTGDKPASNEMMTEAISLPLLMYERYGDALLAVLFGMKSAEQAFADCQKA